MKNWIVFIVLLSSCITFGQNETPTIEVIDGKRYYIHIVQAGNTLWGIHNLYNVSVEDIVKVNPGTEKGVNEGQKLIIPISSETILHEVVAKETLYSISKKYGVTADQIIAANPGTENGVKIGQKISIPGVEQTVLITAQDPKKEATPASKTGEPSKEAPSNIKISFTDTIIQHVVLDHETMYSISKRFMVPVEELQQLNGLKNTKIKPGQTIKIPIKKEKIETVPVRKVEKVEKKKVDSTILYPIPVRTRYKIAILLPFNLDKGEGYSEAVSTISAEFYMGAKLALDSLEKIGFKAEVIVLDTKNDTISLKKTLADPSLFETDVIYGPLFPDHLSIVARWCKENKVRLVAPVGINAGMLKNNQLVYAAVPTDATLLKGLASFSLKKNKKDQVILIKSNSEKDKAMYESFRNEFLTGNCIGTRPKLIEATLDNFTTFMKKEGNTVLVFPTNEKGSAIKFMNIVNKTDGKFNPENISVYGTKEWINMDDVKASFKNKYHFHYSSPNDFNYKYSETENLHRKYRSSYGADMTKIAVQGYDVLFYFCTKLLMKKAVKELVMNTFEMNMKGDDNGFENEHCYILKQEDYQFINVDFE